MKAQPRVFATLGPGDVVATRRAAGVKLGAEGLTSIPYSEQFVAYCRERKIQALGISANVRRDILADQIVTLENCPKLLEGTSGVAFHVSQLIYAAYLCWRAVLFRADYAIIDSGTTHYFLLLTFRLFGIRVIANLHNVLWPRGFPPKRLTARVIAFLDRLFFTYGASAAIGVSPECERQVAAVSRGRIPFFQYRCQFREDGFIEASPYNGGVFRLCFSGRAKRYKGLLDLVEIAISLRQLNVTPFIIEVCGDGPALDELQALIAKRGVADSFVLHGALSRNELLNVYARSHAMIVPTRSNFCEGVPAVCAEAALARLPVIASDATNSLDVIGEASIQVPTDEVDGFVKAIVQMFNSPRYYFSLRNHCAAVAHQFLDRNLSMPAAIDRALNAIAGQEVLTDYSALFNEGPPARFRPSVGLIRSDQPSVGSGCSPLGHT
ncbi:hypothetical protein C2U70_27205 [Bradyrhizobium guangdongense]|uniref:glycosyltransferase family 4 protein n=1 Tax=Bradyrhizobium guangdongense TaxID=1325090 RepID=UPI00112D2C4A|nr:glycosyltransferase family 4 protein [Bradyrhizobium guangdongense]TPQ30231.1 hypothetical protein C2U70_27205 [Bradyrhizobium guangdongense]